MTKNLTNSNCDRQKILDNPEIVQQIEKHWPVAEYYFNNRFSYNGILVFTRQQIEQFFKIDNENLNKYIEIHQEELNANGYVVLRGSELDNLLSLYGNRAIQINLEIPLDRRYDLPEIEVLELFSFKTWLNLIMIVSECSQCQFLRSRILDLVIDFVAKSEGGSFKYINTIMQLEVTDFYREYFSCSHELLDALSHNTISETPYQISNKIYKLLFKNRYRFRQVLEICASPRILKWKKRESEAFYKKNSYPRLFVHLYCEVHQAIFNLEKILAREIQLLSEKDQRKIEPEELETMVLALEQNSACQSFIEEARTKVSWLEFPSEECLHKKLAAHQQNILQTNPDEFISAKSKSVKEKLANPEILAVLQRL